MADFTSSTAAASEARPHRRRRPTTAATEVDPDAVTSAPRLFSQRRSVFYFQLYTLTAVQF
jgi:hypothetical protein